MTLQSGPNQNLRLRVAFTSNALVITTGSVYLPVGARVSESIFSVLSAWKRLSLKGVPVSTALFLFEGTPVLFGHVNRDPPLAGETTAPVKAENVTTGADEVGADCHEADDVGIDDGLSSTEETNPSPEEGREACERSVKPGGGNIVLPGAGPAVSLLVLGKVDMVLKNWNWEEDDAFHPPDGTERGTVTAGGPVGGGSGVELD